MHMWVCAFLSATMASLHGYCCSCAPACLTLQKVIYHPVIHRYHSHHVCSLTRHPAAVWQLCYAEQAAVLQERASWRASELCKLMDLPSAKLRMTAIFWINQGTLMVCLWALCQTWLNTSWCVSNFEITPVHNRSPFHRLHAMK